MEKKRIIIVTIFIVLFIIAIILSTLNYKDKYSVNFETGTNDIFLTRYVDSDNKIKKPDDPKKDGYIFKEWQLNGEKYDFDNEVNSDIILTAKWIKEEYITITFDGVEDGIEPLKVLKGESIGTLPSISKDNYEFLGWYIENEKYINQPLYDDIVLTARFTANIKVGDIVKIVGSYSNALDQADYLSTKAIGWDRVVLDIIDGYEYPYIIGDENGVLGYFKIDSIEKKS